LDENKDTQSANGLRIPKGLNHSAQGCPARRATLGDGAKSMDFYAESVASALEQDATLSE
jgi:hypothetical protein